MESCPSKNERWPLHITIGDCEMDFQGLDQVLSLVDGKLTLAASSLPGTPLQALLSAYNGDQPLIIENAQRQTATDSVTVTGAASFMNVPSLPVTAVFHLDVTGTPVATLRFTLIGPMPGPNPWRFSTSLPKSPLFFFNDTATTEIYTLSLHDALPI